MPLNFFLFNLIAELPSETYLLTYTLFMMIGLFAVSCETYVLTYSVHADGG